MRYLAKTNGIDLSTIQGTGKNGRVTKADVLVAMGQLNQSAVEAPKSDVERAPQQPPATNIQVPVSAPTAEDKVKKIVGI